MTEKQVDYEAQDAEVWAIVPDALEAVTALGRDLAAPFPRLLADADGATRRRYAALLPEPPADSDLVLFVLDRFGAPQVVFVGPQPDSTEEIAQLHNQALDWLAGIELECPE